MDNDDHGAAELYDINHLRLDRIFAQLSPEQWLKLAVINSAVSPEYISGWFNQGYTVDEMFTELATWMYPPGIEN